LSFTIRFPQAQDFDRFPCDIGVANNFVRQSFPAGEGVS